MKDKTSLDDMENVIVLQGVDGPFQGLKPVAPCNQRSRAEIRLNLQVHNIVQELLQNNLDKQIIEEVYREPGEVLSHIFWRANPDGSHRLSLNLSNLNVHIERKQF